MEKLDLEFAKIVSTPTLSSWSMAYNSGNLFAVISLTKKTEENQTDLNVLGKEIIDSLEKEYYVIEDKNLETIKEAVLRSLEKATGNVFVSLAVGAIITHPKEILYVFSKGNGKIFLKRADKIGTIIDPSEEILNSASGFLEDNDIIIFETSKFSEIIPKEELSKILDHLPPSEIAETLSPKIHEKEEGGASAIILCYKKIEVKDEILAEEFEETIAGQKTEENQNKLNLLPSLDFKQFKIYLTNLFENKKLSFKIPGFSHSKKLFLTIGTIILTVLIISIFFAIKKKDEAKFQVLFENYYPSALKKYEEGQSLASLNKNLARESLKEAKAILEEGKPKFALGSKEEKQINTLLQNTNELMSSISGASLVKASQVSDDKSEILSYKKTNSLDYISADSKFMYFIDSKGINSLDKGNKNTKLLVKTGKSWETGGFGTYLGNVYLVDKKENQIYKFNSVDYSKSNYLTGSADVSKSVSIAIDGSIYVLSSDGGISKFTKGKADTLNISGLETPFSSPSKIFTNVDTNNLYILDNGNSRIVVFDKKGAYDSEYSTEILKDAKDFEVLESQKKIFILSQNKLWEIEMK